MYICSLYREYLTCTYVCVLRRERISRLLVVFAGEQRETKIATEGHIVVAVGLKNVCTCIPYILYILW